jgi:hypothetical protein
LPGQWALVVQVHWPLWQACPAAQVTPQPPQLLASVWVLVSQPLAKMPSQSAEPEAQVVTLHAPLLQPTPVTLVPAVQVLPQPPQLLPSVFRLTQAPLQLVRPVEHAVWHWPLEQTWPVGHWLLSVQVLLVPPAQTWDVPEEVVTVRHILGGQHGAPPHDGQHWPATQVSSGWQQGPLGPPHGAFLVLLHTHAQLSVKRDCPCGQGGTQVPSQHSCSPPQQVRLQQDCVPIWQHTPSPQHTWPT